MKVKTRGEVIAAIQPKADSCCHGGSKVEEGAESEVEERMGMKVGIALVLAGQGMVFGLGYNLTDPPPTVGSNTYFFLHGGLILSALAVMALLGPPLVREAVSALHARRLTVEGLFVLSILGAFFGSFISTVSGRGSVYYEVVAILLAVYTVGKSIGARSRARALREANRIREDFQWAFVLNDKGERQRLLVNEICCRSAHVCVQPGEPITVDGTVLDGIGFVFQTAMTGEPTPVVRRVGDRVLAGTYSVDGSFVIRPSALAGARKLDAVLATVEESRLKPSRLQEQADRIMRWFLPLVVTVSVSTFLVWLWIPGAAWWQALFNSMAVLLVACPCALGLATPIAVWSALLKLSAFGLITRRGAFIDCLASAHVVLFDKTGTLSEDRLVLVDFVTAPEFSKRRAWLKASLATIERQLAHPVARAFEGEGEVDEEATSTLFIKMLKPISGRGVIATMAATNGTVHAFEVGELTLMPEKARGVFKGLVAKSPSYEAKKIVYVAVDGRPAAVAVLDEKLRGGVEATFEKLRDLGLEVQILTGDPAPRWHEVAGVPVEAGLSPLEKKGYVEGLLEQGKEVIFVGDGINDTAAMARASAAIAMGGGVALAQSTAAAVLMGDELSLLPRAVILCRRVHRSMRSNLIFAATYNLIGLSLAALGLLHPVVAALLMVGSSTCVSFRALRAVEREEPFMPMAETLSLATPQEGGRFTPLRPITPLHTPFTN